MCSAAVRPPTSNADSNSSVLTVRSEAIARAVSHVVSADPALAIPGYAVEREFGWIRILRRQVAEPAVRLWQGYTPTITGVEWIMSRLQQRQGLPRVQTEPLLERAAR